MYSGKACDLTDEERTIKIHEKLKGAEGLNTILSHESLHILQGDNSSRKTDTFKKQMSFVEKMKHGLLGQHDATSNIVMNALTEEGKENERMRGIEFGRKDRTKEQKSDTVRNMNYLREGVEVQARIHEVIIDGYPRWGKVPANLDEFYAAMKNAGFKMPPEIEKRLENLPENSSARGFLTRENGVTKASADIQKVSNSFSKEGANTFWNKTMPALYADMITMYGDTQGGKRFGLGSDLKAAVSQKTAPTVKQTTPSLS
jgi:hypothetical protein